MTNKFYPKGAQKVLGGQIDFSSHAISAALISSGYNYSAAHEFLSDVGTVVGTKVDLASKTIADGTFDADDLNFGPLAAGSTIKAIVLFKDTGLPSTSPLLCYLDEVTGFPFSTNGGGVSIPWSNGAAKILSLV